MIQIIVSIYTNSRPRESPRSRIAATVVIWAYCLVHRKKELMLDYLSRPYYVRMAWRILVCVASGCHGR